MPGIERQDSDKTLVTLFAEAGEAASEVAIPGERRPAKIRPRPLRDPDGERMRN